MLAGFLPLLRDSSRQQSEMMFEAATAFIILPVATVLEASLEFMLTVLSLFFVLFFCTATSVCQELTFFFCFSLFFGGGLGQFAGIHFHQGWGGNRHAAVLV